MSKYKGKEGIKSVKSLGPSKIPICCEICKNPGGTLLKVKQWMDKKKVYLHIECVKELVRQGFNIKLESK